MSAITSCFPRIGWRLPFDGFETGNRVNTALDEFRTVLAMADAEDDPLTKSNAEPNPSVTYTEFVAGWASAALRKIFEDVFQGVYYDADESLTTCEKSRVPFLALHDRHFGMITNWC
jgi:hypothetical protein